MGGAGGNSYAPATKCAHGLRSVFVFASLLSGAGTATPSSRDVGIFSMVDAASGLLVAAAADLEPKALI